MKTATNKTKMDKAIQEAIKRVESKEPQFNSNTLQASTKYKLAKPHKKP